MAEQKRKAASEFDVEAQYPLGNSFLAGNQDEIEEEQRPANQMDFPPSNSDGIPTMSISSQYPVASVCGALNFIRSYEERLQTSDLGQGLAQMFCLALDGLAAIGSEEITKISLNLFFQMTACLVAYYIYLNSGSSSADQESSSAAKLSKPLFYCIAATDTVGFLAAGIGIAIRKYKMRAGSILGGIGAVLAAATYFLVVMSTFIPKI